MKLLKLIFKNSKRVGTKVLSSIKPVGRKIKNFSKRGFQWVKANKGPILRGAAVLGGTAATAALVSRWITNKGEALSTISRDPSIDGLDLSSGDIDSIISQRRREVLSKIRSLLFLVGQKQDDTLNREIFFKMSRYLIQLSLLGDGEEGYFFRECLLNDIALAHSDLVPQVPIGEQPSDLYHPDFVAAMHRFEDPEDVELNDTLYLLALNQLDYGLNAKGI